VMIEAKLRPTAMPRAEAENFIFTGCRADTPDVDEFLKSLGIDVANDQGPVTKDHRQDADATQ